MDTTAKIRGGRWLVALALAALVGCGNGDVVPADDLNSRGLADGGAGAGAAMTGVGGSTGAAGARAPGTGGITGAGGQLGTGGALAGLGGLTGAGGARPEYNPCDAYGWSNLGGTTCSQLSTQGIYLTGSKDGHRCQVCGTTPRPAGTPECTRGVSNDLCVLSCNECTFQ